MYDLKTTKEGDLEFFGDDLALVAGTDLATQVIWNVLNTGAGEWKDYPNIAPDIFSALGRPNTKEDGMNLAAETQRKLNELRLFDSGTIRVIPVPLDFDAMLLRVDTPAGAYGFTLDFNAARLDWITPAQTRSAATRSGRLATRPSNPILRRNHQ